MNTSETILTLDQPSENDFFEIIGNECRRKILQLLVLEPHYVSQLSKILGKSQPAILKHMKELEKKGIVIRKSERASKSDKGPERHFFSINRSFTLMYSLSPYNAYQKIFFTDSEPINRPINKVKQEIDQLESIPAKVSTINKEIESINKEMENLELQYIDLEKKRNNLLNLVNDIIEESDVLNTREMYEARQLLRKHVCESSTCVQEISNLLNKKEVELAKAIKILKTSFIEHHDQ